MFTRKGRVLDAACGTGYGALLLVSNGTASVDCLDRSLEAVQEAQASGHPRIRTLAADVTSLPVPNDTYDVYLSFETLEHVQNDRALVDESRRVLRPDGVFICSTPNRRLLSPGHTIEDGPSNPYHMREYDLSEFESLLRSSFSSIEFFGQTGFARSYADRLNTIGRASPRLALRLHQLLRSLSLPWEREDKHGPQRLPPDKESEVFIAVCKP
jgi:SAM-dependent methyltransferase